MAGKLKIRIYRHGEHVADCYTTDEAAILLSVLGDGSSAMIGRLTYYDGSEAGNDETGDYPSYDEISAELSRRINAQRTRPHGIMG